MSWVENNEWLQDSHDHSVHWTHLKRFVAHYRPFRTWVYGAAALVLLGSAATFLIPVVFRSVQVALTARDTRALALALTAFLSITLFEVLVTYCVRRIRSRIATRMNRELVLQYYRKILNLAVEDFIAFRQRTNLFQRVIDAMSITGVFTDVLLRGGQCVITAIVVGAVIATVSPIVLGVLILGSLVLFVYTLAEAQNLRVLRQRALAVNYPLVGKMTEILSGLFTIKALAASVRVTSDITDLVDRKTAADFAEAMGELRSSQVSQVIRTVVLVSAAGTSCALMISGRLMAADVLSLYILANLLLFPVAEVSMLYQALSRLSVNIANYFEVLDLQDEVDEVRVAIAARAAMGGSAPSPALPRVKTAAVRALTLAAGGNENGASSSRSGWSEIAVMPPPADTAAQGRGDNERRGRGHVVFQDLEFAYRGGAEPVLNGIDLEVQPAEKVALIGRSGVGKTTLIRLLLGFLQPQRGTILVDGVDVPTLLDKNGYRRQFGVVSQQDVLFGTTLRENLAFGLDEAVAEERVEEALRMVNLWDGINRLPEALETIYAEDLFSGGQRQRFFIARALLRRPTIVLLDEPTSALDFRSEGLVMQAIERLVGDRTTITIAHRLSTVRNSDRVVVLEDGRIKATGSHEELYDGSDYYRALCEYNSFMT